ncbi:MAG: AbrB/MazE/SpoVT family DNA-binding domain-containing protein [Bacillota bacterium]
MSRFSRSNFLGSATVGERGQVVIPADARKAYGIEIGDKLLVFSRPRHAGLLLIKADLVNKLVSDAFAEATQLERLLDLVSERMQEEVPDA